VNILGKNTQTVKKNKEALVVPSKEIGPEHAAWTLIAQRGPPHD